MNRTMELALEMFFERRSRDADVASHLFGLDAGMSELAQEVQSAHHMRTVHGAKQTARLHIDSGRRDQDALGVLAATVQRLMQYP